MKKFEPIDRDLERKISEIESLYEKAEYREAYKKFSDICSYYPAYNKQAISILARFNDLNDQIMKRIISFDQQIIEKQKIGEAFLICMEQFKEDYQKGTLSQPPFQQKKYIFAGSIILSGILIISLWLILHKPETSSFTSKDFIRIPGGEYIMGCITGDADCNDNEKPSHKVKVNSFLVGKYEVTQGQWQKIMEKNPSLHCKDCPIVNVSWNDVQKFIRELNKKTGRKYRLPTEEEWEFACRCGGKEDKYSGGNDMNQIGWYDANSNNKAQPVGTKQPNALGLYDMNGNVWEWCEDVYCPDAYENKNCVQTAVNPNAAERVIRGGGWQYSAVNSRCTSRKGLSAVQTEIDVGFRLVMEDVPDAK